MYKPFKKLFDFKQVTCGRNVFLFFSCQDQFKRACEQTGFLKRTNMNKVAWLDTQALANYEELPGPDATYIADVVHPWGIYMVMKALSESGSVH